MKLLDVYLTVAVLLLSLQTIAQKKDKEFDKAQFKRLYVGDTVPMESIVFNNVRNYPGGKAKLSDFKGKYIILDFWDKSCSACITAFPHMEELQQQFKDDIQVLLVTKNSEEELASLFKNSPNVKNTKLPIVIGDHILTTQLFPHSSVPHHVWLDREGKVVATTWSTETTTQNLKDLITGKSMAHIMIWRETFPEMNNQVGELYRQLTNPKQSLLTIDNGRYLKLLKYYVPIPVSIKSNRMPVSVSHAFSKEGLKEDLLLPYYSMFMSYNMEAEDLNAAGGNNWMLVNESGNVSGLRIKNMDIDFLYRLAYGSDNPKNGLFADVAKVLVDEKAKQFYEEITDTTNEKRHLINNSFCYESCLPDYTLKSAKIILRQDLARFFGMIGSVEERPVKHLILTRTGIAAEKNLWAKDQTINSDNGMVKKVKDGWIFQGTGRLNYISTYIRYANQSSGDPIIVNDINFNGKEQQGNIDIMLEVENFKATTENLPLLRKELAKYGLDLKEEIRNIKVLVLKPAF